MNDLRCVFSTAAGTYHRLCGFTRSTTPESEPASFPDLPAAGGVESHRERERDYEIHIQECGVVINRIDVRKTQANEMVDWIRDAFDDTPAWEVRERAAIQRALANGASIFIEEPECDQIEVFENIAANLDEQFDIQEVRA